MRHKDVKQSKTTKTYATFASEDGAVYHEYCALSDDQTIFPISPHSNDM